jgi:ribokinase
MSRTAERGKRVTIREVARRAGVSVGTVSHVINGSVPVRPETRAAVEQAIADLNFTPHLVARMLIGRRGRAGVAWQPGTPRLTAIGYVSTDYTARVRTLPHREDRSVAEGIDKTLGGPAANVAVAAAGLGPPFSVAADLLTVIGDDPDSDWAVSVLGARGVDTVAVGPRKGRRLGRCVILVEANGARTILYEGIEFPEEEVLRSLRRMGSTPQRHVIHWQGSLLSGKSRGARLARELGYLVSAQTAGAPASALGDGRLAGIIESHDVVFLNREAARTATGWHGSDLELVERVEQAVRSVADRTIVLTLADAGAVLFAEGRQINVAAPSVAPIDATGAGDAFAGVFLAAWLNGAEPAYAVRAAVIAASRSVTIPGAQEMRLSSAELEVLLGPTRAPLGAV